MTIDKPTCRSIIRHALFLTETGTRRLLAGDLSGAAVSLGLAADMLSLASDLAREEVARKGAGNRKRHGS